MGTPPDNPPASTAEVILAQVVTALNARGYLTEQQVRDSPSLNRLGHFEAEAYYLAGGIPAARLLPTGGEIGIEGLRAALISDGFIVTMSMDLNPPYLYISRQAPEGSGYHLIEQIVGILNAHGYNSTRQAGIGHSAWFQALVLQDQHGAYVAEVLPMRSDAPLETWRVYLSETGVLEVRQVDNPGAPPYLEVRKRVPQDTPEAPGTPASTYPPTPGDILAERITATLNRVNYKTPRQAREAHEAEQRTPSGDFEVVLVRTNRGDPAAHVQVIDPRVNVHHLRALLSEVGLTVSVRDDLNPPTLYVTDLTYKRPEEPRMPAQRSETTMPSNKQDNNEWIITDDGSSIRPHSIDAILALEPLPAQSDPTEALRVVALIQQGFRSAIFFHTGIKAYITYSRWTPQKLRLQDELKAELRSMQQDQSPVDVPREARPGTDVEKEVSMYVDHNPDPVPSVTLVGESASVELFGGPYRHDDEEVLPPETQDLPEPAPEAPAQEVARGSDD